MKIGIPRALLYYWYGHEWEAFWQSCGCETLTSPITDRATIKAGSEVAVDELCLPIKIFLGHVINLVPRVDRVMIPHLVKVEADAYICPKFMGLPDLVAHTVPAVKNKAITVKIGPRQIDQWRCLSEAAAQLGVKPSSKGKYSQAQSIQSPALQEVHNLQPQFGPEGPELIIGLLGHPYCLYDRCFNLDLLTEIARNRVGFLTPEMMPKEYKGRGTGKLEKELFWTMGRSQLDALEWMLHYEHPVDGFIQVTPFACGPEAIVGDLLERRIKAAGLPLLKLNFEEHSGEAGVITRLEAFLDLIKFRSTVC